MIGMRGDLGKCIEKHLHIHMLNWSTPLKQSVVCMCRNVLVVWTDSACVCAGVSVILT